jgi:hypothetical protein
MRDDHDLDMFLSLFPVPELRAPLPKVIERLSYKPKPSFGRLECLVSEFPPFTEMVQVDWHARGLAPENWKRVSLVTWDFANFNKLIPGHDLDTAFINWLEALESGLQGACQRGAKDVSYLLHAREVFKDVTALLMAKWRERCIEHFGSFLWAMGLYVMSTLGNVEKTWCLMPELWCLETYLCMANEMNLDTRATDYGVVSNWSRN